MKNHALTLFSLSLALLVHGPLPAQAGGVTADTGCPMFHCTPEATGMLAPSVVPTVNGSSSNNSLGTMKGQGCSGNGKILACLFSPDGVKDGVTKGTLKVLDAQTLQPLWGSAGKSSRNNLNGRSSAMGQAPVVFADGRIGAGDATHYRVFEADGNLYKNVDLPSLSNNYGLVPISSTLGIVSGSNGLLVLLDIQKWVKLAELQLVDPETKQPATLVSPSTGSDGVVYAVAQNSTTGRGYLFSVRAVDGKLQQSATYVFKGAAGASPVVVKTGVAGAAQNLVLVHMPTLLTDAAPQDRLVALLDSGTALTPFWPNGGIALSRALAVSPTVDVQGNAVYYQYTNDKVVYANSLTDGSPLPSISLAGNGLPSGLKLNSHMASTMIGGYYSLVLSAAVSGSTGSAGQYVFALAPSKADNPVLWSIKASAKPDSYTAAWNLSASSIGGVYCPVVVARDNGILRVCNDY